ncbi:HIT-like domain-containing protein [Thamnocephalis sphaerospora]|uniref:HIT-like domain-containing protein n=1 Tax=Thamnocephalis sphaerospora TaxID=78915 RepID=A0A4P9XJD1_9FUNG|nr:HIT-like domain-containing protein [Thamnocephalis sphaerospora]|eukprot:RKP05848.1 HIT-like domain-containing protein [Thamnocephalis sphaerospora]
MSHPAAGKDATATTSDPACIFCRIVRGDLPAHKVYEDEHVLAFLGNSSSSTCHTLLIPKKHYRELRDMPADSMAVLGARMPLVADAVMSGMGAQDFNILQNNGHIAGQKVLHVHFHVIPRYKNDRHWPRSQAPRRLRLEQTMANRQLSAIRAHL